MIDMICEFCGRTIHFQDENESLAAYCPYCHHLVRAFPVSEVTVQPPPFPVREGLLVKDMLPMWKRPISATVGRLNAPFTSLILGTTAPFKSGPQSVHEDIRQVIEYFDKGNTPDRLELQFGSSMPVRNIERLWKRNGLSIYGKLLGTLCWPFSEIMRAIGRLDCYDPFAHTVVLYHRDPAILTHELGHAQDFAHRKWRTLYILGRVLLPVLLYQEWKATSFGIMNLRERDLIYEAQRANRVLCGGFGSYLGSMFKVIGIILGALIGQAVGAVFKPFKKLN